MAMLTNMQSNQKWERMRSNHVFGNARNGRDCKKMMSIHRLIDEGAPSETVSSLVRLYMENYEFHDKNDGDWEESSKALNVALKRELPQLADQLIAELEVTPKKKAKSKQVASSVAPATPWQFQPAFQ